MSNDMKAPVAPVSSEEFAEWVQLSKSVRALVARELELRKKIFAFVFPSPKEGMNVARINEIEDMKASVPYTRKLNMEEIQRRQEEFAAAEIPLAQLIEWKPELKLPIYRALTDDQRELFDEVLLIKDGSPTLEIVRRKGVASQAEVVR
jgi:hypothetical protein